MARNIRQGRLAGASLPQHTSRGDRCSLLAGHMAAKPSDRSARSCALCVSAGLDDTHNALETLQEHVSPIKNLQFTGGGASALWSQILADVSGLSVSVPRCRQSTSLGAAIIAGVAVGIYPNLHAATRVMSMTATHYNPDASTRAVYEAGYRSYLRVVSQRNVDAVAL